MEKTPYTLEDVTYLIAYGKRRGFMAGVVFVVIIEAHFRNARQNRILRERNPQGPY